MNRQQRTQEKHKAEAKAVGLTLIGPGKEAHYRIYQFRKCKATSTELAVSELKFFGLFQGTFTSSFLQILIIFSSSVDTYISDNSLTFFTVLMVQTISGLPNNFFLFFFLILFEPARAVIRATIFIVERYLESDHYYAIGKRCLANYYNKYGPIFDEKVYATELELEFVVDEKYRVFQLSNHREDGDLQILTYRSSV